MVWVLTLGFLLWALRSGLRLERVCNISNATKPSWTWNTRNSLITVLEFFNSGPLKARITTRRQYTLARVQHTGGGTNTRCRNMLKVTPPSAVAKFGLCSGKIFSCAVDTRANSSRVSSQLVYEGWIWDGGNLQQRACEIQMKIWW